MQEEEPCECDTIETMDVPWDAVLMVITATRMTGMCYGKAMAAFITAAVTGAHANGVSDAQFDTMVAKARERVGVLAARHEAAAHPGAN